ncbi:zinc carboxypeptidase a [Colletotrichum karsti]|uniref:Zinc carboxypeptidase a n=1 Tax=Colletotrichum karsti TaxID=1095194 RepID=A0A9P6I329_9PEZI|nr:zinc carboxypeptidase a [Colletotrichum karsti]KAF9873081.1 zinc carboxypeptidase a [Colletotrichum karsti]
MGRPALDQLPTDLLNEITLLIFRGPDRLKNLIKFSQTSKRVRSHCIQILFKDVGICGRGLPSPPLQECIELLNRVVSNPDIASAVQHFIAIPWEDYKSGISPRTLFLGVDIPAFLCSNAPETEADRKPFDLEGYMKGTEAEVTQSLMEMILAHTTNIRSIDSCSYNSPTAFDTLPTASTALHRPLLFPQLTKILHDDVVWQKVQHWAEWAPHLESLRLRRVCGPVNRAQFDNVIRLHLVDATFTGSEIKELMSGFPNVTNFSFSWPSEKTKQQCLPQDVVEALEPLCTKLRLLRLHMAQVRISHDEDSSNELFTQLGGLALVLPLASAAAITPLEKRITYDGFKAFRIATHNDPASIKAKIANIAAIPFNLDNSEHLDVAIPAEDVSKFEKLGLETQILHEDLGADIAEEGVFAPYESNGDAIIQALPSLTWFNSYHSFADHQQFIRDLQSNFPSNSEIINAGNSYGGRSLLGIHLWGSGGKGSKPAIYWHGTVHAREWITTMVVEYLTYQLIDGYQKNDAAVKAILDKYDFYILPIVNPDGFAYSQTNDRLWRKNRLPRSGSTCIGTDINRNWPFNWQLPGGASTSPCSETYKGQAAGDTPEMVALKAYTDRLAAGNGIKLFIDWHSYGQYILLPYGYDCNARAANHARQMTLAGNTATTVAQAYGTRFTYGPSCSTLYATTGSAPDYLTGAAGAEVAWTIELRPSGSAGGGFVLPAAQILPSAIEQWNGMKYLLANV